MIYSGWKNKDKINIFGEYFTFKNSYKYKIIFRNKIINLRHKFSVMDLNQLKLKMVQYNNILNLDGTFFRCDYLTYFSEAHPYSKNVSKIYKYNTQKINDKIMEESSLFKGCSSINNKRKYNIQNKIINIRAMFSHCKSLKYISSIENWDTSKVKYMNLIFNSCNALTSLPDISKWNTSNVINMGEMFKKCSSLKYFPDISKWNTSKVIIMFDMFKKCSSLISLPDLSKWDTSKVDKFDFFDIFSGCNKLKYNLDYSNWNNNNYNIMSALLKHCLIIDYKINIVDPNEFIYASRYYYPFIPLYEIYKTIYKISPKNHKIKIFGEQFVNYNKRNCVIVFQNKIFPLKSEFIIKNNNNERLKTLEILLLKFYENSPCSYMFYECDSLLEFYSISSVNKYKEETTEDNKSTRDNDDNRNLSELNPFDNKEENLKSKDIYKNCENNLQFFLKNLKEFKEYNSTINSDLFPMSTIYSKK